ncbi:DNA polymerase III subunit chi [Motiliproteus sediminis]|uniref:DNA polymerase III subunit chi n=1 Tax=Motiliproteus sediminis TaxID=1468178 RepID=UPI001AEFA5A6|nr:DNA polymerase III subunit chi [Motiliproteus sediminis]
MPRADFYVLPAPEPEARSRFLVKLLEKILGLGRQLYIRVPNEAEMRQLDKLLWEYRADAFLPHSPLAEGLHSPIEIGYGDARPAHRDVFLNLCLELPDVALEFDRITEIVIQQPEVLDACRANYRRCQQADFEIHMNDMRPKTGS